MSSTNDNNDTEAYILLTLADSNLPTGAFVASSGLESHVKHGFSSLSSSVEMATVNFVRDSLGSYARTALPFVADAHILVSNYCSAVEQSRLQETGEQMKERTNVLKALTDLDELYHTMTLNHVARRASISQGVALLTLYSKGFARPSSLSAFTATESQGQEDQMKNLLEAFKLKARREEVFGHLPVCWGMLTAALGLNLERAQYLHLFLHCRGLLSASVRLNDLGPYAAQQVLFHAVQPLIATEMDSIKHLRTGLLVDPQTIFDEPSQGPANTWPLGEILAARHDLQHSRIFNS
ncbi:hypothetical protein CVT24_006418 [Panaeolus cyanescens]|uniref:Urease accessory protein UreF n=1 Tax=Panaeolus cyanescens TaxID=181874 RepID=A0A409WHY5_9AGAR|nr:hypothetical protein CVT24_006418 [Panaeolus cyanescens]